ncbi:hypothetical protein [Sandaracinus amylolyticus]|uniref:Uncharacterized protein n=1 Tax=Sandaracinus amylolyticus TaxID=927083 RepID=A0A0F6W7U9_9BACT|nr:hypothetical protein [Sandaracinus amylolyticus]AKF09718.1 hypothetical protein DB32_006867 [Sandaracinus amylolyticus]
MWARVLLERTSVASPCGRTGYELVVDDELHPGWRVMFERLRAIGLAHDLAPSTLPSGLQALLALPPEPVLRGAVLAAYYLAGDPVVAKARRERDRVVELHEGEELDVLRTTTRLAVALDGTPLFARNAGDAWEIQLAGNVARVRRVTRHARMGMVRTARAGELDVGTLLAAVHALLRVHGEARRWVRVRSAPGMIVLVPLAWERAQVLAELDLIAGDDEHTWAQRFDRESRSSSRAIDAIADVDDAELVLASDPGADVDDAELVLASDPGADVDDAELVLTSDPGADVDDAELVLTSDPGADASEQITNVDDAELVEASKTVAAWIDAHGADAPEPRPARNLGEALGDAVALARDGALPRRDATPPSPFTLPPPPTTRTRRAKSEPSVLEWRPPAITETRAIARRDDTPATPFRIDPRPVAAKALSLTTRTVAQRAPATMAEAVAAALATLAPPPVVRVPRPSEIVPAPPTSSRERDASGVVRRPTRKR